MISAVRGVVAVVVLVGCDRSERGGGGGGDVISAVRGVVVVVVVMGVGGGWM